MAITSRDKRDTQSFNYYLDNTRHNSRHASGLCNVKNKLNRGGYAAFTSLYTPRSRDKHQSWPLISPESACTHCENDEPQFQPGGSSEGVSDLWTPLLPVRKFYCWIKCFKAGRIKRTLMKLRCFVPGIPATLLTNFDQRPMKRCDKSITANT